MKKYLPLIVISPLVVILDQITKIWIIYNVALGGRVQVFPGFFEIVHIKNPGAAFGMLAGWDSGMRNWFFFGIGFVALVALYTLYAKTDEKDRGVQIPLALILGGAVGNLLDRLYLGVVTDFLLFHWENKVADFSVLGKNFRFALSWPAFNIADSAITCGAIFLVLQILFAKKKD